MYKSVLYAVLAATASSQIITSHSDPEPAVHMPAEWPTPEVDGYDLEKFGNKAINAPINDCPTYIGHQIFSDGKPFDVDRCAKVCEETTAFNEEHLDGRAICRFFNTYILVKDGKYQAQVCSMYTRSWGAEYAKNEGYNDGKHQYTITASYGFTNADDPGDEKSCIAPLPEPAKTTEPPKTTGKPTATTTKSSATGKPTTMTTVTTTTSRPEPTQPPADKCFKIQARGGGRHVDGRWLWGNRHSRMSFKSHDKYAETFSLDKQGQLRHAESGSVASRDAIGRKLYGPVRTSSKGHRKNDFMKCEVKGDVLKCATRPGDDTYAKGSSFYVGQDGPRHMERVELKISETQCPRGLKVWEDWY